MVAFQFPPFAGSSAIQRTLRFVQHLPNQGWEPIVLTAAPFAYESTSDDLVKSVPPDVVVERAFALDAARHLSLGRRYPRFLARPDRWRSWRLAAVRKGQRMIARYSPAVLWSTYPIATAHMIGSGLQRRTGLPWIADFRDPMAQEGYPSDPATWRSFKNIEDDAVHRARFTVFTTSGAAAMYRARYPDVDPQRLQVVENGYDEGSFKEVERAFNESGPLAPGRLTLLHSGAVYTSERDPTQFFQALGQLKQKGRISAGRVVIRFRASGNDELLRRFAKERGIEDLVELLPPLPYGAALDEMCRADGLLVFQAANCNQQIPAKLYEYLRAGRPVLGLTDPKGDTAGAMRRCGASDIVPLDRADLIEAAIARWLEDLATGVAAVPDKASAQANSRAARAAELVRLLDAAVA